MKMYDDLIKQLRYCADATTCRNCLWKTECCPTDMQKNAADAIEGLNRRIDRAIELYNRNVEKSAIYEALAGISPEPSKDGST